MPDLRRITDSGLQSSYQQRCFHSCCASIDMSLIKNKKLQLCFGEHLIIIWSKHHVFKHRIVRHQNMRWCFLHCFSGYYLVGNGRQGTTAGILEYTTVLRYARSIILLRAAVVNTERNIRIVLQDHSQAIHRIDQNCPDTTGERSGLFFPKQIIYDGQNKTFCLAGTGTRCHNQIMLLIDLSDGFLLMQIKRPLQLDLLVAFRHTFFEISEQRRKFALSNQAFYIFSNFK